jgi:hypothetical protein
MSTTAVEATPAPAPVAPARIRGIAIPLPDGEQVRWQGAPTARSLARFTFHQRKLAAYFYLMLAWWAFNAFGTLETRAFMVQGLVLLVLSSVPVLVAEVLARLIARGTVYAITDRRVVIKAGLVFPMTINIPHRVIGSAAVRHHTDGTGQIAMPLIDGERIAYGALWPHCRPFELTRPVPLLRALTDVDQVGRLLRDAVLAQDGGVEQRVDHVAESASGRTPAPAVA